MSENIPLLPQTPSRPGGRRLKSASTAPSTVASHSRLDNLPALPMLPSALSSFSDAFDAKSDGGGVDPLGLASKRQAGAGMASRIRKGSAMELGRYGARGSLRDEHSMGRSGVDGRMGGASLDVDRSTRAIPDFAYSPLFTSGLMNTSRPRVERAHTVDVSSVAVASPATRTRKMPTTPSHALPDASPVDTTPERRHYTQDLARFGTHAGHAAATFSSPARTALSASQSSNKSLKTASPSMHSGSTSISPSTKSLRSASSKSSLRPAAARTDHPIPPLPLPLPLPKRSLDLPRQASFGMLRKKSSMPAIDQQQQQQVSMSTPPVKMPSRPPRPVEGLGDNDKVMQSPEEPQEELLSDLPDERRTAGGGGDSGRPSMDAMRTSFSRDRLGLPHPTSEATSTSNGGGKKSNGPWSSFARVMGRKMSSGPLQGQAGLATPPRYRPSLDSNRPRPTPPPAGPLPDIPQGRPSYSSEMATRPSFAHEYGVRPSFQVDATPVARTAVKRASPNKTPTPAIVSRSGFEPDTPPHTACKTTASSKIKKWFSRSNLKEAAATAPTAETTRSKATPSSRSPLSELGRDNISPHRKLTLPPLKEYEVVKALPARPSPPRPSPVSSNISAADKSRSSSAFEYTAFETGSAYSRPGSAISTGADSDKENVEPNIAPARQAATARKGGLKYHLPSSSSLNKAYNNRSNAQTSQASIPLLPQDDLRRGTWGLTEAFASMGMDIHNQDTPFYDGTTTSPMNSHPSPAIDSSIEWEFNDFCQP